MTLKEYQTKCLDTAIYPNQGNNHLYTFLGMIGEYGEFERSLTGDLNNSKKELGDVMWYYVMCCYELGINVEHLSWKIINEKNSLINPIPDFFESISKLSELFKKEIRDGVRPPKEILEKYFVDIFLCLVYTEFNGCVFIAFIDEIFQMNINKLQSRKERNVIQGSGDNR